jgi:serine/threonine-protein kinase
MQPLPPNIGRYVVEELVGVGGMGEIYRAQDPVLRRTVAIKLISTKLMSGADRADYIRRFRREAEAAARCAHPNIVSIYDFALHDEQPYLAMEFVSGRSLRQLLDEVPVMDIPDAIAIMLQVLDALTSAHRQGVIHQDVKPANIMLTAEQRVKVGDFGISRIMTVETMTVFSTVGTPSYMSPEQCRGDLVDARSDLFSAGATLFEMVSGERPFQGRSPTEVSHRIQNDSLPLLPSHVRSAAPRLQLVLERAMGKHPADRFDTGADMAEALREVMHYEAPDSTRIPPKTGPHVGSDLPAHSEDSPKLKPAPPLAPELLAAVQEKLKIYIGPIAGILVQSVAKRFSSATKLCMELELSIPDGPDRERFRREVASLLGHRVSATAGPSLGDGPGGGVRLPEQELERAEAALIEFAGPIATILVRRAAASVSSIEDLWEVLSSHIASPAERSDFLRRRSH